MYDDPQIQYGISSFANFGQAVLAVFQIITRDDWSDLMQNLADGYTSIFAKIYCCAIIVLGYYFMLNLILAVIMSNFTKIQQQEAELDIMKREEELRKLEGKLEESKASSEGDATPMDYLFKQREQRKRELETMNQEGKDNVTVSVNT